MNALAGGDLVTRKLGSIRRVVAGRRDVVEALAPMAAATPLPWIGHDPDPYDQEYVQTLPHRRQVLTSSSYETHLAGLRAGLGVGVVPAAYLDLYPELAAVDGVMSPPPIDVYLLTRKTARRVPKVAAVWDVVVELSPALVGERPRSAT